MRNATAPTWLLLCGMVAPVVFIAGDIGAALSYPGYSYTGQAVSELSAFGAPTRSLVTAVGLVFILLLMAFGIGVWRTAGRDRSLRAAAVMIAAWGIVNLPGSFFAMRQRGEGSLAKDAAHLILTGLTVLLIVLSVGFGSSAGGRRFRFYSLATILATLGFGALASTQAPAVAAGLPTPWLGLIERVSVYAPAIWLFGLAVVLRDRTDIGRASVESDSRNAS